MLGIIIDNNCPPLPNLHQSSGHYFAPLGRTPSSATWRSYHELHEISSMRIQSPHILSRPRILTCIVRVSFALLFLVLKTCFAPEECRVTLEHAVSTVEDSRRSTLRSNVALANKMSLNDVPRLAGRSQRRSAPSRRTSSIQPSAL